MEKTKVEELCQSYDITIEDWKQNKNEIKFNLVIEGDDTKYQVDFDIKTKHLNLPLPIAFNTNFNFIRGLKRIFFKKQV